MKFVESNSLPRLWQTADGFSYSLFRQAGGCLEICQRQDEGGQPEDLVHICADEIPEFLTELARFVKTTADDWGLTP